MGLLYLRVVNGIVHAEYYRYRAAWRREAIVFFAKKKTTIDREVGKGEISPTGLAFRRGM